MLETYGLQATAILKEMDENFPPVQPTPHDNIEKIMYQAGQRSVVEWYKQQMEN
jgi:hypothetical protein